MWLAVHGDDVIADDPDHIEQSLVRGLISQLSYTLMIHLPVILFIFLLIIVLLTISKTTP